MTPAEKDRLIAEHLEPFASLPEVPEEISFDDVTYSSKRAWRLLSIYDEGDIVHWAPRSVLEPEMTVLLLKALLTNGWIICGNRPWDGTGLRGIAIEHRESNGGDDINTYRTDDKIDEAVRDAYVQAFKLGSLKEQAQ